VLALQVAAAAVLARRAGAPAAVLEALSAAGWTQGALPPAWLGGCGFAPEDHGFGEFALASQRVVLPEGVAPAVVFVRGGKISAVQTLPAGEPLPLSASAGGGAPVLPVADLGDRVLSPGLVDIHAHMNDPGREHWEGFPTGTAGMAAGGVTALVDMPLNSYPSMVSANLFGDKLAAARGRLKMDVGFWGGLVPENAEEPAELRGMLRMGALGLKAFMAPSGMADFGNTSTAHLDAGVRVLAEFGGRPLFVHAELVHHVPEQPGADPRDYATYLATRPRSFEKDAVRALIDLADRRNSHVHVAHLSDAELLPEIAAAKAKGVPLTAETCPHYLAFAAEEVPFGDTRYKCAPPVREAPNRGALMAGLLDGTLDSVGSDHSPCPEELKLRGEGDFLGAWGGINGAQYSLPVTWTAAREGAARLSVDELLMRMARWWGSRPAEIAGLADRKGSIEPGKDADLVVWDPESPADTRMTAFHHRNKVSPYEGRALSGRVLRTYVRGHLVFRDGAVSEDFCGEPVLAL